MRIIAKLDKLVKTGLTISEAIEQVIPGADIKYWTHRLENYSPTNQTEASPKKKSKKTRSRTQRSTKKWSASQVLDSGFFRQRDERSNATVELVDHANEPKSNSIFVTSANGDDVKFMILDLEV